MKRIKKHNHRCFYDNKIEYDGIRQKFVPTIERKGLAAVSSSFFAALYSAFGKYDVVHIHAEGPAFFSWLPKILGKRVVVTIHGIDWQREKWKSGFGSKFIRQGEKNAVKYADEIIVLSKGVQDYFKDTYGSIIIFFCVFMHFATDYIVNLNTTNNVVVTFSLLVEKTIRKGRIFSGVYYILLGNLIAKSEYHIGRIYLLAIFIASYLIVAFTSFLPIKMIMCITFFLLVISVKATGNGIYFRRTSTIMYYTSTALIITQIFVEGTLGKLQWRRDYEHDITYHGCRNWQPIWNRNKTVGTGR